MALLNVNFLSETFTKRGSDLGEFKLTIKAIDEHTAFLPRVLKKIALLSIAKPEKQDKKGFIKCFIFEPENTILQDTLKTDYLPEQVFLNQGNFDEFVKETVKNGQPMILDHESNSLFFLSEKAINTLAQRIGMTGDSVREQSIERDIYIAKKMNQDIAATLIVKQYRQVGKIFAVMSKNYINTPLSKMLDLYEFINRKNSLGNMVCRRWKISHGRVSITFAFLEHAKELMILYGLSEKIIPCIEFSNSDIGIGSLRIRGCWETAYGHFFYDRHKYTREHRTDLDMKEIGQIVQSEIIDYYDELPNRLSELMEIDITPKELNLSDSKDCGRNRKAIMEAFQKVFNRIEIVKCIGKKREMELVRYLDFETINEMLHYTAYDIILEIFTLPKGLEAAMPQELAMHDETMRKLKEAVSLAPYIDFTVYKKVKK